MTNKSKRIGTQLEVEVVKFLKSQGYTGAYRPALSGKNDVGDVHPYSQPRWIIECKAGKSAENASVNQISKWTEEAIVESRNVGSDTMWLLVVKRRGVGEKRSGEQDAYMEVDFGGIAGKVIVRLSLEDAVKIIQSKEKEDEEGTEEP